METMLQTMQILATILVAITMAPALAHAFEFPGKMRLSKDSYITVQAIYYPGFTSPESVSRSASSR